MVNPNAFISVRGNRVHIAAFTLEDLHLAVAQIEQQFDVYRRGPVFHQYNPIGFNQELIVDLAASSAREKAKPANAQD